MIKIFCVGKLKQGPLLTLIEDYTKRMNPRITIQEVEIKDNHLSARERKRKEGDLLQAFLQADAFVIALDIQGKTLSSEAFSQILMKHSENHKHIIFIIGGADGLDDAILNGAHMRLSFGPNTWPHMLARLMLIEQIYRAQQITNGHPYHH